MCIYLSFCLPKLSVPPLRNLSRLACLRVSHELKHSRLNPVVSAFAIYIMYVQYTYLYEPTLLNTHTCTAKQQQPQQSNSATCMNRV